MIKFSPFTIVTARNILFLAVAFFMLYSFSTEGLAQSGLILDFERGTSSDRGLTISVDPDENSIILGSYQSFIPTQRGRSQFIHPMDVIDYSGTIKYSYLDTFSSGNAVSMAKEGVWCSWGRSTLNPDGTYPPHSSVMRCISSKGDTLGYRQKFSPLPNPLYSTAWNRSYGSFAKDDSLIVYPVRTSRRDSISSEILYNRYVIVTDITLTNWDTFPMPEVVPGVSFLAETVDASTQDSVIAMIGFTEDRSSRSGDSLVIFTTDLNGNVLNNISFDNVGRYANETDSGVSSPSIELMPYGDFVVAYPRYDSSLSPIPSHDNIVTTISKYGKTNSSPDWVYYPKYDSSQNYRIRGVKYDEIKHQILFYGHGLKFKVYDEALAYSYGFISALDPDTGELLWERYIDPRSRANQQGTNPEVEYTLRIINDIALEDTTSIFIIGTVVSDPSTAFYHDSTLAFNLNPWVAQLDRNGCFNEDCGDDTNNEISVTPVFEIPYKPPRQEVLFDLHPSPVRQGQVITASWISERIVAPKQINIFNSIGQKALSSLSNGNYRSISVQQLVPGNYFMKWGDYTKPFVVK